MTVIARLIDMPPLQIWIIRFRMYKMARWWVYTHARNNNVHTYVDGRVCRRFLDTEENARYAARPFSTFI